MEIKKDTKRYYTTYDRLQKGAVFKLDNGNDNIYMKVDEEQGVRLNHPEIVQFNQEDKVREIRAELHIMED